MGMIEIEMPAKCGSELSDERRWQAVLLRDVVSDGAFVYAVRSTGVFCRPSCGARKPASRAGVEFFVTSGEAEDAGYRGCLRCRPDRTDTWQHDLLRVQRICRLIEASSSTGKTPGLHELAEATGGSPFHLQRSFKRILGISPLQYRDAVRLRRFKAMLNSGSSVGIAARKAGIRSPEKLYGTNGLKPGMSPAAYSAGAPGTVITYAIVPCPLGLILLAATDSGVCSVQIGTDAGKLEDELRQEFPQAAFDHGAETLAPFVLAVLSSFGLDNEASDAAQRLPLDIRATAFQWRVWKALRSTAGGLTCSYAQLAEALGCPHGARAIGTACASNPVALAIPCHRVIRADGSPSGYRWGLEQKGALLTHERVMAAKDLINSDRD